MDIKHSHYGAGRCGYLTYMGGLEASMSAINRYCAIAKSTFIRPYEQHNH
jgi:hypothetical protein